MRDKRGQCRFVAQALSHGSHVLVDVFVNYHSSERIPSLFLRTNFLRMCVCVCVRAAFGSNLFPFKYLLLTLNTMRRVYLEMPSQLNRYTSPPSIFKPKKVQ